VLHCDTATCAVPSYPPAGTDTLNVSLTFAHVYLDENDDGWPEYDAGAATFDGEGTFERSAPYVSGGYNIIDTEILSMELDGTVQGSKVTIRAGSGLGLTASTGQMRERTPGTWFPADTWFDLFFEVDRANPAYGLIAHQLLSYVLGNLGKD